jgi:hypothetical protein
VGAVRTFLRKLGLVAKGADGNGLRFLNDKRRAQRLPITMPVAVYGYVGEEPFVENTESINVSARGGLLAISAAVSCWQKIILSNLQTDEDVECRVVRLVKSGTGKILVGVEFPEVAPRFWRTGTTPVALSGEGQSAAT